MSLNTPLFVKSQEHLVWTVAVGGCVVFAQVTDSDTRADARRSQPFLRRLRAPWPAAES